jgi:hypothetical protein
MNPARRPPAESYAAPAVKREAEEDWDKVPWR